MKYILDAFNPGMLDIWVYGGVQVAKDGVVLVMDGVVSCYNGMHNTFATVVANQDVYLRGTSMKRKSLIT